MTNCLDCSDKSSKGYTSVSGEQPRCTRRARCLIAVCICCGPAGLRRPRPDPLHRGDRRDKRGCAGVPRIRRRHAGGRDQTAVDWVLHRATFRLSLAGRRKTTLCQLFSRSAGLGLDIELDVVTLDPRHLHVCGVFLALGSGELVVELDPDLCVHVRRAADVVWLETRLAGDEIDHRLRGSIRLDGRAAACTDKYGKRGSKNQQCASHRRNIADQYCRSGGTQLEAVTRQRHPYDGLRGIPSRAWATPPACAPGRRTRRCPVRTSPSRTPRSILGIVAAFFGMFSLAFLDHGPPESCSADDAFTAVATAL